MILVNIIAFLMLLLFLTNKYDIAIVESIPIGISILLLVLYGLAFVRGLGFIDIIGIAVIIIGFWWLYKEHKNNRNNIKELTNKIFTPSFILFVFFVVVMTLAVNSKMTVWWDDYNFWSTDVKSIYYLNGFASKYHNVAPEFGDYPPGTQLIKWWFLHFNPHEFNEGLMFAGYYFMIFGFLAPLLKFFDNKKIYISLIAIVAMIFLPGTVEAFYADGCCADLCMAVCYGSFLISVIDDEKKNNRLFYYGRSALFLSSMVICKNSSMVWFMFAVIFAIGYGIASGHKVLDTIKKYIPAFLFAGLVLTSWYAFCLVNRRVAKLTSNSIKMVTGNMGVPAVKKELLISFMEGFFKYPIHRYSNWILNISPAIFFLIVVVCLIVIMSTKIVDAKKGIFLSLFTFISGLLFYGITLICHLTIFATEEQYLEPFAMVSSIERYSCPFSIGAVMLIIYLLLSKAKGIKYEVFILVFILLTTDPSAVYRAYIGYRDNNADICNERNSFINPEIELLKNEYTISELIDFGRILYVRDVEDLSWVSHAYISYELAPVSVVYEYVDCNNIDEVMLTDLAKMNHANFVYMNEKIYKVDSSNKMIEYER